MKKVFVCGLLAILSLTILSFMTVKNKKIKVKTTEANYLPTDEQIETMAKLAASNYFIDINQRIGDVYTSPEKREDAQRLASVDEFVRLGGQTSPELRISLRDFESPTSLVTKDMEFVDFNILEKLNFNLPVNNTIPIDYVSSSRASTSGTLCISVGLFVCVSYGSEVQIPKIPPHGNPMRPSYDPNVVFDQDRYLEAKSILLYLRDFASNDNFQSLLTEMYALPKESRSSFVQNQVINSNSLNRRNISVPNDIIVQRSAFADNRPTLFCLTKYRADGHSKMTITFDSSMN